VFVVASAREGFDPAAVLFEFEGVRRDTPPSREAGQVTAGTLASRTGAGGFPGTDEACSGYVQPVAFGGNNQAGPIDVATACRAKGGTGHGDFESETFVVAGTLQANSKAAGSATQQDAESGLLSELSQPGAQATRFMRDLREASEGAGLLRQALSAVQEVGRSSGSETQSAHRTYAVRRLTVEECEFLQGFPRGYTRIPWRNKPAEDCPDGPRYKALGNSMAVPCMRWIGQRIQSTINHR
jgi:DNA (cytosine-5)-methyltransferase 1